MESLCGKLMNSTFILPCVAGNYRRRQNGSPYYDCTISSRVLFLIIGAMVIVFTASKNIPTHTEFRLAIVLLLLSVVMICSMFGLCSLACLVQRHGLLSVVAARRHTNTPKLQVIFLCAFGIASGLYYALVIGKQIECSVFITGGLYWNVLFCFNILLILSIFKDVIFLSYFSPFELKQTTSVNWAMFVTLTGNIFVSLYIYLVKDTFSYVIQIDPEGHLTSCIERNSTMTILIAKSREFLGPAFVEYALLSVTIFLEIWSPTQVHHPDGGSLHPTPELRSVLHDADIEYSERIPLLNAVGNEQSQQTCRRHAVTEVGPNHSENSGRRKASQMVTLVGSFTAGLGLVICYTAQALDIGNIDNIRCATEIYELTLRIVMVIVICVGFFCLVRYCTPDSSAKPLRPRDYVYLLSAFGMIMCHFYEVVGGDVSSDLTADVQLYKSIISIIQDYLQVVFLLQANRCKKSRSSVELLESVLIFTMIINLIFWFNNSFLLAKFPSTRILKKDIFSKEMLHFVYKILLPVSIFFRFTSFLEYYANFGKYKS